MANTYTQIYIQIVFAVRNRQNLISDRNREELQKYISGIVAKREQRLLAIYCMPDHTHLLIGLKPSVSISDLVRDIKAGSSGFVNEKGWIKGKFSWQEGFGAFSYSKNQKDIVVNYILNQPEHHMRTSFREEYLRLLEEFEIDFDEKYLFNWIEQDAPTELS
ncbi:MAG: IS200/IS605 family transposase [Cyclobacteriaceae bacterium]